jgi:hypothetical protein
MLTFAEAREIAASHYGEPVAVDGLEDDDFCLVTLQRVRDDEARGLITVGGCWIVVNRETGTVSEWPQLDYLDRVGRMRPSLPGLHTVRSFSHGPQTHQLSADRCMRGPAGRVYIFGTRE